MSSKIHPAIPQATSVSIFKIEVILPNTSFTFKGGILMPNVQIYPSRTISIPNDRISKILFDLTEEEFRKLTEVQVNLQITEVRKHKRFGEIVTPVRISIDDDAEVSISEPLDQFDCAVLSVCISEYHFGNRFITPAIIYRGLTGKIDKGTDAMPSVDQLAAINHSIKKLMRIQLDIYLYDVCEYLGYNDGKKKRILANVLPCKQVDYTINGQKTSIIELLAESPLWTVAHLKNDQIISYDTALLDMPNQQNTPMLTTVKHYVMRRVMETILHNKQMTPTITFADVFQKCRLENAHKEVKRRIRNFISNFFEHLIANNVIKSFQFSKKGTGFYSVSFKFDKAASKD